MKLKNIIICQTKIQIINKIVTQINYNYKPSPRTIAIYLVTKIGVIRIVLASMMRARMMDLNRIIFLVISLVICCSLTRLCRYSISQMKIKTILL